MIEAEKQKQTKKQKTKNPIIWKNYTMFMVDYIISQLFYKKTIVCLKLLSQLMIKKKMLNGLNNFQKMWESFNGIIKK